MKYLIPIEPIAKGRPRFTKTGRAYTPGKTKKNERDIQAWASTQVFSVLDASIPLSVEMSFYFTRPKSVSIKKRPMPVVKPDIDNMVKQIVDALNGIAWVDDNQIVELVARKFYSKDSGYIELRVEPYDMGEG